MKSAPGTWRASSVSEPPGCAASDFVGAPADGESPLQLVGEHQVGQLRPGVRGEPVVAILGADVVEVEPEGGPVTEARDRDDARARHREDPVEQQGGQGEVTEVVGPELQLEAVGGELAVGVHDPGVVDEQIDAVVRDTQRVGSGRSDRVERGEVEVLELEPRVGDGRLDVVDGAGASFEAADRQHHGGPRAAS